MALNTPYFIISTLNIINSMSQKSILFLFWDTFDWIIFSRC